MDRIVVLPSRDGDIYSLYAVPPEGMPQQEVLEIVNREISVVFDMDEKSIKAGGDGCGEKDLMRRLSALGFRPMTPIRSGYWD